MQKLKPILGTKEAISGSKITKKIGNVKQSMFFFVVVLLVHVVVVVDTITIKPISSP
jgi:hypothetical protein